MTEPKFLNDRGPTTADDPKRIMWYGPCGYWTDDWSRLSVPAHGIPQCPICETPGCRISVKEWNDAVASYQSAGHPGYAAFYADQKEQCHDEDGLTMMQRYKEWLVLHPNGRVTNPRAGAE